ncbi:MAG: hypothetical protein ACR5K9_07985 [Wolbachia sp.]
MAVVLQNLGKREEAAEF